MIAKAPYESTHNLEGINGMIKYFTAREEIEEEVMSRGFMKCSIYNVDENNWDKVKELIWRDL